MDFFKGATRDSKWRESVNEMGEAPVLQHAGRKLTQSGAILTYLADRTGKFAAAGEDERLEALRWILFDNHKFTSYLATYRFMRSFLPQAPPADVLAFLKGRFDAALAIVEKHLGKLKTEVAKSLPIGLGDEQRLTQVLLNLVGNAIKFTDAGEVCVTAKAVNGRFAVSVADTGPGIPEQEQTRIFDQFHQVDGSLTKAKGGTGLGLAIAKQIVEMHGARIWVESTPGEGASFQMELPIRAAGA